MLVLQMAAGATRSLERARRLFFLTPLPNRSVQLQNHLHYNNEIQANCKQKFLIQKINGSHTKQLVSLTPDRQVNPSSIAL
jgi:hypothetical protein